MKNDKSWCASNRRNSKEFLEGLASFMEIAKNYTNEEGLLRCPCRKCLNMFCHPPGVVEGHIHAKGFQRSYTQWVFHGEPAAPRVVNEVALATNEMIDVTNDLSAEENTNHTVVDEGYSSSYVNSRYKKIKPETEEVPGIVENWHDMHYKEGRGLVNEEARLTYQKIQESLAAEKTTQSSSCSSVNEQEIASKVFEEQRDHNVGCSQKRKNMLIRSFFPSSSAATSSQPPLTNEQVKKILRENNKKMDRKWKNLFQKWIAWVCEKNHNLQIPPLDDDDDDDSDDNDDDDEEGDEIDGDGDHAQ